MPYVTQAQVQVDIPLAFLTQALDDNADGAIDAGLWDALAARVATQIEGLLGQRFAVPFTPPLPAVVAEAALTLACYRVYKRRVADDQNPFKANADEMIAKLKAIAAGREPLAPGALIADPGATFIGEQAKTYGGGCTSGPPGYPNPTPPSL